MRISFARVSVILFVLLVTTARAASAQEDVAGIRQELAALRGEIAAAAHRARGAQDGA